MTRRWVKVLGGVLLTLLLLLGIVVFILTQTNYGRERVRRLVLDQLAGTIHGRLRIGRIDGNLLTGARLSPVSITDSAGAPFLSADSVWVRYSLRSLLSQRIYLDDLRLFRPVIVLDKRPGEEWNWQRIFPADTTAQDTTARGFGSWVQIRDLRVQDGRLLVRNEWLPPDTLQGAARDSAVAVALSPESRLWVVRVPRGFQTVQDFRALNGHLPFLRLADPDSATIRADIARLSTRAFVFRPPAAEIRDLRGTVLVGEDSLWLPNLQLALPGTRAAGRVTYYTTEQGGLRAALNAPRLALPDLRFAYPALPDGGGRLQLGFAQLGERNRVVARDVELRVEQARLAGHADAEFGRALRLGDTDVRIANLDTRLVERLAPAAELPVSGVLGGRVALAGVPASLRVDGNLAFTDRSRAVSRILAAGEVGTTDGFRARDLRLRFEPVQVSLARAWQPELPVGGVVTGTATLNGSTETALRVAADLAHVDGRTGRSRVLADGGVAMRDGFAARALVVRFEPLQLALARAFSPEFPLRGSLAGRARLDGRLAQLRVDADVTHRDPQAGRSRLLANGWVRAADGVAMRDLRLTLDPLQVRVARAFNPELPIGGTLAGTLTLNGSPQAQLATTLALTHRDATGVSRLNGTVRVGFGEVLRFDAALRAPTLALATLGRFAPAAGLQGTASGTLNASGTTRDLRFATDLAVAGGGSLDASGRLGLGETLRYDVRSRFSSFDAGALTTKAPSTALTGTLSAQGVGTDPATMRAALDADLVDTRVDTLGVDAARLSVRVADGLATVPRGLVQLASARAEVQGSFGLRTGRDGTLRYQVTVDSLADFAGLMPAAADTTPVPPRPALQARRVAQAREDSLRIARATEVERAATGSPAAPTLQVDTVPPLPRDSLAGSLRAEGVLAGNLHAFDLTGSAALRDVVAAGNAVRSGRAEYSWRGARTPRAALTLNAAFDSVLAGGFALDSASAQVNFAGTRQRGSGSAELAIFQDADRDYRLRADYTLALQRSELRFADLALRFDTTRWASAQPGVVRWGGGDLEIDNLELRSNTGGRIFADGRLPDDGPMNLQLAIERLQLGDVTALLQDTAQLSGVLDLRTTLTGTRAAPRFEGETTLAALAFRGTGLPDARAEFAYANTELSARAELFARDTAALVVPAPTTTLLARVDARVPMNLALAGYSGPRLLERPLAVDVRADSLPLDALPRFTDAVDDVQGRVRGTIAVRGTAQDPQVNGVLDLDLGSFRIVQPGVRLRDIAGTLRLAGDSAVIDSLVARSGGGPIRLAGTLDISEPTAPGFDLTLDARNAVVLNNELARELRADADLAITGPFDGVRVSGDVAVQEGTLYIPESNKQLVNLDDPAAQQALDDLSTDPEVLPAPNPLLDNLQVDVGVRIARNTWVRNSDANVEIYTPDELDALRVRMNNRERSLTLLGTVNADNGEYEFSGRRFALRNGAVVFLGEPEINPLLQLTAVYEVARPGRPLLIEINVGGYLQAPTITLSSNSQPPLSQSDLLSYLAFGRSSNALMPQQTGSGVTGGGGLGGLGALATRQLAGLALGTLVDDWVSQLETSGSRRGLDVLRISPADLPDELIFGGSWENVLRGTEIEAGKYLNRQLFVSVRGRPTPDAYPGLRLEYRTPGGLRWVNTWEPRFLPSQPTFELDAQATSKQVFGSFLFWERRF